MTAGLVTTGVAAAFDTVTCCSSPCALTDVWGPCRALNTICWKVKQLAEEEDTGGGQSGAGRSRVQGRWPPSCRVTVLLVFLTVPFMVQMVTGQGGAL